MTTTTTNAVVPNKAKVQLPQEFREEQAAEAAAIAKRIGAPSGDNIRVMKDKTFQLPNGDASPKLDVVVVDFVSLNQYYPGKYNEKDIKPPSCYAIGTEIDLMKPSPNATDPQSESCKICPQNQWGSDGRGKACKNQRLVAVLPPDKQADGPLLVLKVAPTGTRYFDAHVKKAVTLAGGLLNVRTEVTCDPSVDYASVRFDILSGNDEPEAAWSRRKEARERLMTEPDYGGAKK